MTCSSRYVRAQSTSPGSTGCSSSSTRFVTPPVEVITTTITARGCSWRTSTCRTDAAPRAGAETSASSRVACESVSVVDSQRGLELAPDAGDIERQRLRPPVDRVDELLRVDPVAVLRRHPPRGRVRMREQAERLELGELAPHRRRRHVHARPRDERFRPDGLAGRDVLLDHPPQDLAPAGGELFHRRIVPGYRRRQAGAAAAERPS